MVGLLPLGIVGSIVNDDYYEPSFQLCGMLLCQTSHATSAALDHILSHLPLATLKAVLLGFQHTPLLLVITGGVCLSPLVPQESLAPNHPQLCLVLFHLSSS